MNYICDGKDVSTNHNKNIRNIQWIKINDKEYLIVCIHYSAVLDKKAHELLKSKNLNVKLMTGPVISYNYICHFYIANKINGYISDRDKQYIKKIINKNEQIYEVD